VFERVLTLDGDLDADQRARLLEIANKCPVHRTLEGGSHVATVAAPELPAEPECAHFQAMETACD
jgi:putative redox protein